jgi:hypothetical protein
MAADRFSLHGSGELSGIALILKAKYTSGRAVSLTNAA